MICFVRIVCICFELLFALCWLITWVLRLLVNSFIDLSFSFYDFYC